LELLEKDGAGSLSLRAVARKAGVSPSAPYRHYADREALLSAVASVGYAELANHLAQAHPSPATPGELADVAVAYIDFAVKRPALFRAMFSEPCDRDNAERVAATELVSAYLADIVSRCFPDSDSEALGTGIWGLVHGLAFLHLDGKLDATSSAVTNATVRGAVGAVLALRQPSVLQR
jgi:AcrR family transcriptional regulator